MDVSVVIPNYNRCDALMRTLGQLARTNYPAGWWEAVVVDDGSSDGSADCVRSWATDSGAPVRVLEQPNAGPAAARNRGAAAARGRYLVFIDNDILVEPDFLPLHVATLDAHPGCWVLGRITHPAQLRATAFGRYRDAVWEAFHMSHPAGGVVDTDGLSAANLGLPAADFRRFGGFDTDFTIASSEDWELGFRARRAGVRVLYHPGILVVHDDWAVSLDRFCERQRLYSISDVLLWGKYGEGSPRAKLVRENGPVCWRTDSPGLVLRKVAKRLLAPAPAYALLHRAAGLLEGLAPDTRFSRRGYQLAIAVAIFRGVREGFRRYGGRPAAKAAAPGAAP